MRAELILGVLVAGAGVARADVVQGVAKSDAVTCKEGECKGMTVVAKTVDVILLGAQGIKDGDVVTVVQPLLGMAVAGKVERTNHVVVAGFLVDRRQYHDGVLVVPGAAKIVFVAPTAADVAAAKAAVGKTESLERVKKATAVLEVGLVDVDGDGKADFGSTYGCKVWGDGICQVEGQFLLVKKPAGWTVLE